MTYISQPTTRNPILNSSLMTMALAGCMLILLQSGTVQAQWATSGANINNTNTGNVGVGTSTPSEKLEVAGTVKSGGVTITGMPGEPGYLNALYLGMNGTTATIDAVNQQVDFRALVINSKTFQVNTWNGGSLVNGLFQNTNGFVGIGTTSPLYSLDVNGGLNGFRAKAASTSASDAIASFENASGIQAIVRANGNVGIGTTTPGYKLDLQGGALNSSGGLCIAGDCKTAWSQVASKWSSSASNIYYNSGNVGIGTSNPLGKLAVTASTATTATFTVTPDGNNNYYAGNIHDGLLVDGSSTGTHGTYAGGYVRLFRIKELTGADSLVIGRGGEMAVTPKTGYAASGLRLFPDASNSYYAGSDYDVLYIGGNSLNSHGTYTGKTVRLIHVTNATGADAFVIGRDGNASFGGNLTVTGTINAKYQDVAEWVESSESLGVGTVVVLDQTKSNQVIASSQGYDTRVAGVISSQPGITLGETGVGKVLVATTGRVRIKVDASRGSIQIGDLLVTSDVPGIAMKSQPIEVGGVRIHRPGTLIGKALEPLARGTGEILVLLSLQ